MSSDLNRWAVLPSGFIHGAIRRTLGIIVLARKIFFQLR